MKKSSLKFLKQLLNTPSPSGFEARAQDVIRKQMDDFCDDVYTDVHGNLVGVMNPDAGIRVMLAGHCDEIGLMVMHIDDKGFLYFAPVGGMDPSIATGQRVSISSTRTRSAVFGVIGATPIHLLDSDKRGKPAKFEDMWIDIGAKNRKDAEKAVAIGDYVSFDVGFEEMRNGLVAAHGFDDRVGAFVLVEAMRALKGKKLNVAVYGVSTVQEEIGLRGARTSGYGIDPQMAVCVEVGHTSDSPAGQVKRLGELAVGKGPMVNRGPNVNPRLGAMLEDVARKKKIRIQIAAEPHASRTDANALQITRRGVATVAIRVPNRYMHTPVEVISLKDVDQCVRLLAEFLLSLKGTEKLIPR